MELKEIKAKIAELRNTATELADDCFSFWRETHNPHQQSVAEYLQYELTTIASKLADLEETEEQETDIDGESESIDDAVTIATIHAVKGLEYKCVFVAGLDEKILPIARSADDECEMEEERRLCYVAITRAMKTLTISHAHQRMLYGRTSSASASRFLKEIPERLTVKKGAYARVGSYSPYGTMGYNRDNGYSSYTAPAANKTKISDFVKYAPPAPEKTINLDFKKGDMVQHTAFGRGMVLSSIKMGNDALLEIAFDQIGTRKLMAKSASAHMKRL